MRVGEAIGLDRGDADLDAGVLTVRNGKHGKSRLVPVHATTAGRCATTCRRGTALPGADGRVFISPAGTRLLYCNVHATWKKLAASAGCGPGRQLPAPHPRPAPLLRRPHHARRLRRRADGQATLAVLSTYLGHVDPQGDVLVPVGVTRADGGSRAAARRMAGAAVTALAPDLQAFFTDRLARQRHASGQTVAAYRDAWRLLLAFAAERTGNSPASSTSPTWTRR